MRYLFLFLFVFGCITPKEEKKTVKKKEGTQSFSQENRKRPSYNQKLITNQISADEEENLRAERIKLLKEEEEFYSRGKRLKPNGGVTNDTQNNSQNTSNEKISNTDYPTIKEPYIRAEPSPQKPQILEISGSQGKSNLSGAATQDDISLFLPPKKNSNFVISTSPTYSGISLEEARQILEKFGTVRTVREGEKFALKVESQNGLQTEAEAKEFIRKIIATSFFDVYIEKK
jgi:hypothetical protein